MVRTVLTLWGLADLQDDVQLIASELVANAFEHASGSDSFELEVLGRADGVRLSLVDGSAVRPLVRELNAQAPRGRGMRIVEALSTRWGADDHGSGKRVWVDVERRDRETAGRG
jgi:two-component sensor histidine kinase